MSEPQPRIRDDSLLPAEWKQIEAVCDRFEVAWDGDQPPRLEDFLEHEWPKPQQAALLRDLLIVELDRRRALSQQPNVDDYLKRFAGFESAVHQAFPAPTEAATLATVPLRVEQIQQTARQIGPYKLLQQIGEGGMGTVWMAQQEQPVRRRVALKLIKSGAADKQVIARFEAERQALAMMDHQNIAKVLDAGTAADGSPYFVMELVQGIPITEYCDRNKLTPNERLELFIPVCKAVQHAHQKGIIHRDLKPSNVLVCIYDGQPVAKVIDFGLAKALQHQTKLTDKTMFTEFGQVVGTVQYMSPEQAMLDALDVDTRSDIYSLGVLLYELLAGSTPIDQDTLKEHALLRVLELIREKDPPRPSHRLSSSGEKAQTISQQRRIPVTKLQQILRGDLDWIIMKALEKDRTRRYESASAFADDIKRYLDGDAIEARPPSAAYRLRKFARKHRGLVATTAAIATTLLIALAVVAKFWMDAETQRALAQESAEAAEQSAKRSDDSLGFVINLLNRGNPYEEGQVANVTIRQVLLSVQEDIATSGLDDLAQAKLLHGISWGLYQGLREIELALSAVDRAVELRVEALGPAEPITLDTMVTQAQLLARDDREEEAMRVLRGVHEIARSTLGPEHPQTLGALRQLAFVFDRIDREAEAEELLRDVLEANRNIHGPQDLRTLKAQLDLAGALEISERTQLTEQTLADLQQTVGYDEDLTQLAMYRLVDCYKELDRETDAIATQEALLEMHRAAQGDEGRATILAMYELAKVYQHFERYSDSIRVLEQSLPLYRKTLGQFHPETLHAMNSLAHTYGMAGQRTKAVALIEEIIAARTKVLGASHPQVQDDIEFLEFVNNPVTKAMSPVLSARAFLKELNWRELMKRQSQSTAQSNEDDATDD